MKSAESILGSLERFGVSTTDHGPTTLGSHLKGTHELLKSWDCREAICLAGLCHSIYGTESFSKTPATLENRSYLRELIGYEAEKLAYLFGAHKKDSLWKNIERSNDFSVQDRFDQSQVILSREELGSLITITLANWLEQRPRARPEYLRLREHESKRAKSYLPEKAYLAFLRDYGIEFEK
jgi:hypothetical protein